jgi:hypothetical protein
MKILIMIVALALLFVACTRPNIINAPNRIEVLEMDNGCHYRFGNQELVEVSYAHVVDAYKKYVRDNNLNNTVDIMGNSVMESNIVTGLGLAFLMIDDVQPIYPGKVGYQDNDKWVNKMDEVLELKAKTW